MTDLPLVSVVIPTHNRFKYLLEAVKSVREQTYPQDRLEIIIVNDASTEPAYYEPCEALKGCTVVHLGRGSLEACGIPGAGYVRNKGFDLATGEYIALLDDDDLWFPDKLKIQIDAMIADNASACSTEAFCGTRDGKNNKLFLMDDGYDYTIYIFRKYEKIHLLDVSPDSIHFVLPRILTREHILTNNVVITSSMVFKRDLIGKIGKMPHLAIGKEDFYFWLSMTKIVDILFIATPLVYYDNN